MKREAVHKGVKLRQGLKRIGEEKNIGEDRELEGAEKNYKERVKCEKIVR